MFVLIYLSTLVFFAAIVLWAHSMYEQRITDVQTITKLRRQISDLNVKIEELGNEISYLRVF